MYSNHGTFFAIMHEKPYENLHSKYFSQLPNENTSDESLISRNLFHNKLVRNLIFEMFLRKFNFLNFREKSFETFFSQNI